MICASQLYGMEKEKPSQRQSRLQRMYNYLFGTEESQQPQLGDWNSLPQEVQILIIQALNTGQDLDQTIDAIKAMSITNKALNQMINKMYDLKGFTVLVNMLANKFKTSHQTIANKFNTDVAKRYLELNLEFLNFFLKDYSDVTQKIYAIQLFLSAGADPNFESLVQQTSVYSYQLVMWSVLGAFFYALGLSTTKMLHETLNNVIEEVTQITQLLLTYGAIPSEDFIETGTVMKFFWGTLKLINEKTNEMSQEGFAKKEENYKQMLRTARQKHLLSY